jgi:hypothetical protein
MVVTSFDSHNYGSNELLVERSIGILLISSSPQAIAQLYKSGVLKVESRKGEYHWDLIAIVQLESL